MVRPVRVDVFPREVRQQGTDSVGITWSDGHASSFPNGYLRANCPCASCHGRHPQYALPVRGSDGPRPTEIVAVGRYALGVRWSDGHDSGIYSYDTLRALCPCDDCTNPGDT